MSDAFTRSRLTRFVLAVLAWLPVTFAAWYFAAAAIVWPVTLLSDVIARASFGDLVRDVEQHAGAVTFMTSLKPGAAVAGGVVSVDVNTLLYSFGLPMFAALTLAARAERWPRTLAIGYAVLVPVVVFCVLADFLKNIAITAPPQIVSQTGFTAFQRELIVFAFQFGSLILPAVAPAITWVLTHRAFLERIRRTSG